MDVSLYIIDTSSLIEIAKLVAKDFFRSLFVSLENLIKSGQLKSSEEVLKELERRDDDLYKWSKNQEDFFVPLDEEQIKIGREIINKYPNLTKKEIKKPKSPTVKTPAAADPFVIALAIIKEPVIETLFEKYYTKKIVVCEEKSKNNPNNPKIPDVCAKYGIECININEFFKREMQINIELKKSSVKPFS